MNINQVYTSCQETNKQVPNSSMSYHSSTRQESSGRVNILILTTMDMKDCFASIWNPHITITRSLGDFRITQELPNYSILTYHISNNIRLRESLSQQAK